MSKHILSFVVLSFLTFTSFSQNNQCIDFKVGKFTYSDPNYSNLISTRTDTTQIDSFTDVDWTMTSKITWISDCIYEMEYIEVSDPVMNPIIGTKFTIEIIKIYDTKILCKSTSEYDGYSIEKEMIKIE